MRAREPRRSELKMPRFTAALPFVMGLSLSSVACDSGREAADGPEATKTIEAPAPEPVKVDEQAKYRALAPSPLGIQDQVKDAGISPSLAKHVPDRAFDMTKGEPDALAMRTGVMLADAILAGPEVPKDRFVARLKDVRTGLKGIGAGDEGVVSPLDDFIKNVENDASSREDFITELDRFSQHMLPEEGWGPDDETGPLLQAGGWLAGTNLVAKAIVEAGDDAAAEKLLREKEVVAYFQQYVKKQGKDKGPDAIVSAVAGTLDQLQAIAQKPKLTVEDAKQVAQITDQLFALL